MKIYISLYLIGSLVFAEKILAAPKVAATIKPLHSLVSMVTENVFQPDLIIQTKVSPHQYQLKPSAMHKLTKADIVFFIGPELEHFMVKYQQMASKNQILVNLSSAGGLVFLNKRPKLFQNKTSVNIDPHFWLSPINAVRIINIITDILCEFDVKNAATYQTNANYALKNLVALDKDIADLLTPIRDIEFLVYHDAFQYFVKHYSLKNDLIIANSDIHAPSPHTIYQLRNFLALNLIRTIFADFSHKKSLEKLLANMPIKICYLDGEWGLTQAQHKTAPADVYSTMMYNIAHTMRDCLAP